MAVYLDGVYDGSGGEDVCAAPGDPLTHVQEPTLPHPLLNVTNLKKRNTFL